MYISFCVCVLIFCIDPLLHLESGKKKNFFLIQPVYQLLFCSQNGGSRTCITYG